MPPKKSIVSDDDFSDDDELASEDDEDVKPGEIKSILKGGLPSPIYINISLRQIHDMIQMGGVELEPAYQRDVVWNESKMIGLIQSLFLNYYIPAVMFAVEEDTDGMKRRICIDGKQRLTSIMSFYNGSIPFVSPATRERFYYRLYGDKKSGTQLPPKLRNQFDTMQLQCVEYHDIPDIKQRDLFQRVQMGVSLSAAEKLQAIPGPWPKWIIELQRKYVDENGTLGSTISWDRTRGRPFQHLASFIIFAHDPEAQKNVPSATAINSFISRSDPPDEHFKRKVEMALSLFVEITVSNFKESFGVIDNRVAPAEFIFCAFLIFKRMGIHPLPKLAKFIGEMRTWIRGPAGHVDIRTNGRVSKSFHEYVSKLPLKAQAGERPAAEEYEDDGIDPRTVRMAKRARQSEHEDPTYRETATDRYDENGLGNATRAAKQAKTGPMRIMKKSPPPPVNVPRKINPLPPQPAASRPNHSPMDRPYSATSNGSGFGSTPSTGVNPYTQGYQATQRAPQAYGQPQQAAQPPQYTVEQQRHFAAMHAAQQQQRLSQGQQQDRWATQR